MSVFMFRFLNISSLWLFLWLVMHLLKLLKPFIQMIDYNAGRNWVIVFFYLDRFRHFILIIALFDWLLFIDDVNRWIFIWLILFMALMFIAKKFSRFVEWALGFRLIFFLDATAGDVRIELICFDCIIVLIHGLLI